MNKKEAHTKARELADTNQVPHTIWLIGPGLYHVDEYRAGDESHTENFLEVIQPTK